VRGVRERPCQPKRCRATAVQISARGAGGSSFPTIRLRWEGIVSRSGSRETSGGWRVPGVHPVPRPRPRSVPRQPPRETPSIPVASPPSPRAEFGSAGPASGTIPTDGAWASSEAAACAGLSPWPGRCRVPWDGAPCLDHPHHPGPPRQFPVHQDPPGGLVFAPALCAP